MQFYEGFYEKSPRAGGSVMNLCVWRNRRAGALSSLMHELIVVLTCDGEHLYDLLDLTTGIVGHIDVFAMTVFHGYFEIFVKQKPRGGVCSLFFIG